MADTKVSALTEHSAIALGDYIYSVDDPGGTPGSYAAQYAAALALLSFNPGGRLTLTTGTPVTTSDVTAATTLYYAPFKHNLIRLHSGTEWVVRSFSELSISIPATTDTNYDVFVYDNSGAAALELTAWSNSSAGASARTTALTRQDGTLVKNGDTTRLYLGSIRTTGTSGQCEDSVTSRYVWNYYNRARRLLFVEDNTSHTYTTSTYRSWNGDDTVRVDYITGAIEDVVPAQAFGILRDSARVALGVNSTTTQEASSIVSEQGTGYDHAAGGVVSATPAEGYNYVQLLEWGTTGSDQNYGAISGLVNG